MNPPRAYFGRPWGTVANVVQVTVPVGRRCVQCAEPIAPHDRGIITSAMRIQDGTLSPVSTPVHMECAVRCAVGGLAHLLGMGGPWRGTYRHEALRVVAELNLIRHKHNLGPL